MSKIALSGNASGTGTLTLSAPNTNSDRTLTLPDTTAPILAGSGITLSASAPANTLVTDASGNVGIGTASPEQKLDVSGIARATSFSGVNGASTLFNTFAGDSRPLLIGNSNAAGLPNGILYIDNTNNPNNSTFSFINSVAGGVQKFVVLGNGTVANGTGVYSTISDVRIKKDIVDTSPKLDKLLQVRVVNYTRTDDPTESRQLGVIAQELEEIFPGLVDVIEEKDRDGNVTCPDRKSVKYSIFVPMLVKAIQELNAKVDAQAAEIAALKGQA